MKDTLIERKNDLQENNSRMDEAKNQINDLEHKEAKNNQSEQQQKKESSGQDGGWVETLCFLTQPKGEKQPI